MSPPGTYSALPSFVTGVGLGRCVIANFSFLHSEAVAVRDLMTYRWSMAEKKSSMPFPGWRAAGENQREGLKRSGPNGVIYSCGSACVGVARDGNLGSLNGREFFVFVCRWVLVVL